MLRSSPLGRRADVLIDADDLDIDFADLSVGAGDLCNEPAIFAAEPPLFALHRVDARHGGRFFACNSRICSSSRLINSRSAPLASFCALRPVISSFSCPTRSRSCSFWLSRVRRFS